MSELQQSYNNSFVPNLSLAWVAAYLNLNDWQEVDSSKHPKLRVFQKIIEDGEEPLVVTLPRVAGTTDEKRRIDDVLSTLSALREQTTTAIAQEIATLHSDVMTWRIPNADPDHTIPVALAAEVLVGLRDLLRYGASAESDPRPYFARVTDIGTKYMEQCRLKPTRPGSFIFEIESPIEDTKPEQPETNAQTNLFEDEDEDADIEKDISDGKTFHRRVMERIAQGIQDVQAASESGAPEQLTEKYEHGFNANLCETLREMLQSVGDRGLEFSVRWSPVVEPANLPEKVVRFEPAAIDYLEKAASGLRAVQRTNRTTITGPIKRLGSGNAARTITIIFRKQPIRVSLNQDDYRLACDAHRDSLRVRVTGILEKRRSIRELIGASDFEVIPAGARTTV